MSGYEYGVFVLAAIDAGERSNMAIRAHVSRARGVPTDFRRIDRSLQRLRKAGLIVWNSRLGWSRAETAPCPHCQGTGRAVVAAVGQEPQP